MKRLAFFCAVLTMAAGTLSFTSCSNHEVEQWSQEDMTRAKYEQAFIKRFGQPAKDQTWGFGTIGTKVGVRSANTNGNMWADTWEVPAPLTDAQKDIVRRYFQQNKQPKGISINYSDFFVQQVYKGHTNTSESQTTEVYKAANGGDVIGSDKMNRLSAGSDNDHINNFNFGDCTAWDGLMLMENSKTDCFGFSNSNDEGRQYNDQYVIIAGDDIMTWARNNGKDLAGADVSGMYFVGFDFESLPKADNSNLVNTNEWLGKEVAEGTADAVQVNGKWYLVGGADGYYSDWIVRIIPGEKKAVKGDIRVIAEDLSVNENSDFDFNDVVFDVKFGHPSWDKTTIILQAAGGTLPLYIAGKEVHGLFGVSETTMVNTGSGVSKAPVTFELDGTFGKDANNIEVTVKKDGAVMTITAERGRVASKIAVGSTYEWCSERQDIEAKYPAFGKYVKNEVGDDWWQIK